MSAGKTTTLKMLSGQLLPSQGNVSINGNSYQQLSGILQSIGFCPQFDSVIPKLSGRAHLELFAELRGKAAIAMILLFILTRIVTMKDKKELLSF
jgi:ABC-type multidrug transport system ATPase subunit